MNQRAALAALLRERSLTFGDFVLASGQQSSYYIDARKTTMSAEGQALIGPLGLEIIRAEGWHPDAVGGLTMGADPIAYAVARASVDRPPLVQAFSVRKEAKGHGTRRQIEGNFTPGAQVVVIEDVITSGSSALRAIEAVRAEGGSVLGLLALVDRRQGGREVIEGAGVRIAVITTTTDLI